ncbi:MAG TPA: DUF1343 domain-containing protein [Vicinamibacteria bacterium]
MRRSSRNLQLPKVATGLERLFDAHVACLRRQRLGLIANQSSVDPWLRHASDRLREATEGELVALFGPEHGIGGHAQDLIEVADGTDSGSGLPVRSLYGETRVPTQEMLEGIDALIFDVQDIGARYYTFIWTMALAMEACAREGKKMIVLDRPNPIGGRLVEGNLVEDSHRSFVGLYPIANRHGMTVGELARLFNEEFGIGCDLIVIPMKGWTRSQWFDETGLPWVMPSPNMPTLDTAIVYPGACLFEGTNLSEGRGTTRPFELMGAPWIDPHRLIAELGREDLPGVRLRPVSFQPAFQKFAGQLCGGIQQHVVDRESYRPVRTGLAILKVARRLWPREFDWRPPPYEYEMKRPAIDVLAGNSRIREQIEADAPLADIEGEWQSDLTRFRELRSRYLLYPGS